jgi:hypothetical protein
MPFSASPYGLPLTLTPGARELGAHSVTHSPKHLRLHPAFELLGGISTLEELNYAGLVKDEPLSSPADPVLITPRGIVLAGFGRWRIALSEGISEINCIEYQMSEDEALSFILSHYRARRQWNRFVLICLALTLEPTLQERALTNMQAGGRLKGSAKLPEAQHIDVRERIGNLAGVSAHYVSDVKAILPAAHSKLIEALTNGTLSIPRALRLIKYPKPEQLLRFAQEIEERNLDKIIRKCLRASDGTEAEADVIRLLEALLNVEMQKPGSIRLRHLRGPGARSFVVEDLSGIAILQEESEFV